MPERSEVPEGWVPLTIQDVCDINPPKPKKGDIPDDTPVTFVPMPAVDAERGEIASPEVRPFAEVRSGFTAFRNGDVIMAKITPCMENGKAAIVDGLQNGLGFGSTEFFVLRSNGSILPQFLFHCIRQTSFRELAESNMTGSVGQKRVPKQFIATAAIPLPPLPEQHRIVAAIEALFARLDAANARLERVPGILKQFRQAVLAAACDGRLTEDWRVENPDTLEASVYLQNVSTEGEFKPNFSVENRFEIEDIIHPLPEKWVWISSQTIFPFITSGSRGWAKYYSESGALFIRIGNLDRESIYLDFTNVQHVDPPEGAEGKRTRVQRNDILISITADIGSIGIVPENVGEAYINQHIALARPLGCVNPFYIAWFLHCREGGQKQYTKLQRGATKIGLGLDDIRSVLIPLPPLPEQHEIVRRVDTLFALADKIEAEVAAARERTETMRQSILAQAFSGRLVPTEAELARREGRAYEPASVLLERIRSERKEKTRR